MGAKQLVTPHKLNT